MSVMDVTIEPLKTRKIYFVLRDQITGGELPPGTKLLSEPLLAKVHHVSRVTIRRALNSLEHEGLISRQPGQGTFVADRQPAPAIRADLSNLLSHITEMGQTTRVKLLSFKYVDPPRTVAEALKLDPGERVQRSVRIRFIDGEPFSHLTTFVPERIGITYSEADLASTALLVLLERSGVSVDRASQTIRAALATPETADALDVEIGTPLLEVRRIVLDRKGFGVEYLQSLYRPDRYEFQLDLVRRGNKAIRRWEPVPFTAGIPSGGSAKTARRRVRG